MKQYLFWFCSQLLVNGRPPVNTYRMYRYMGGRWQAIFSRKYYLRRVKVGSGKNSSCP